MNDNNEIEIRCNMGAPVKGYTEPADAWQTLARNEMLDLRYKHGLSLTLNAGGGVFYRLGDDDVCQVSLYDYVADWEALKKWLGVA